MPCLLAADTKRGPDAFSAPFEASLKFPVREVAPVADRGGDFIAPVSELTLKTGGGQFAGTMRPPAVTL